MSLVFTNEFAVLIRYSRHLEIAAFNIYFVLVSVSDYSTVKSLLPTSNIILASYYSDEGFVFNTPLKCLDIIRIVKVHLSDNYKTTARTAGLRIVRVKFYL